MKPLLFTVLLLIPLQFMGQSNFKVRFDNIKQKKIREMIRQHAWKSQEDFAKIRSECIDKEDDNYFVHEKNFLIRQPIEKVWNTYLNIQPKDAWSGDFVSFGVLFSNEPTLHYINDPSPESSAGQVVFINLRFLGGLFNLAVAHKIMEINSPEHLIRTCYIADGKSKGSQYIRMAATPEGYTRITHTTFYKSDSPFRDKNIYPLFHAKVITEFHRNISHYLMKKTPLMHSDKHPALATAE